MLRTSLCPDLLPAAVGGSATRRRRNDEQRALVRPPLLSLSVERWPPLPRGRPDRVARPSSPPALAPARTTTGGIPCAPAVFDPLHPAARAAPPRRGTMARIYDDATKLIGN